MPDPVPQTHEHKQIGDELDGIYIEVVRAATEAQLYLVRGQGNPFQVYNSFSAPFIALFIYTRSTGEMTGDASQARLITEIEKWMSIKVTRANVIVMIQSGLSLFRRYQKAVITTGAIIIKRA